MKTTYQHIASGKDVVDDYYEAAPWGDYFWIDTTFPLDERVKKLVLRVPGVTSCGLRSQYLMSVTTGRLFDCNKVAIMVRQTLEAWNKHRRGTVEKCDGD